MNVIIYLSSVGGDDVEGLHVWRDLFLKELKKSFAGKSDREDALKDACESLDPSKTFVFDGYRTVEESGNSAVLVKTEFRVLNVGFINSANHTES